jgi:hypothetical protein
MDLTTLTLVPGAATSFTTDGYGNMGCSANDKVILWQNALPGTLPAYFDIVIDVNGDGIFDEGGDMLDAKQTPGFGIYTDTDGDGVPDTEDNCWEVINPAQLDSDENCPDPPHISDPTCGDCCEGADFDSDGIVDVCDNCPFHSNLDQLDSNENSIGDVCEAYKGDVNDDKTINVSDVQLIINIFLGVHPPPTDWELWAADCDNQDGINVADIQIAINKILGLY